MNAYRDSLVPAPLAQLPWRFLFLLLAIGGFGLIVLFSAAGGEIKPWAWSQGIRFGFFTTVAILLSRVREDQLKAIALPFYIVVLLLLTAVEIFGFVGGGSRRWLNLGFINLQPSELMKLAIVLVLARFYDLLPAGEIRRWNAVWPALALIAIPTILTVLQPDLGTGLMILCGGAVVTFLAGLPLRLYIGAATALAAIFPIAYTMLHQYQRDRILTFLNPERDPLGTGYHIIQSKIAIGSGGIFGKGFLNGTQSHLDYLPEGHTDFVFATMAEEWGLIGGVLLIAAYFLLINWGLRVGMRAQTKFGRLAAAGLATTIFFYFAINLLMVMGLAPVVGIPLPLVSFGGSAMMTVMLCAGLLMAIDLDTRRRGRRNDW
jgi:rod shape determining protein RodA